MFAKCSCIWYNKNMEKICLISIIINFYMVEDMCIPAVSSGMVYKIPEKGFKRWY